MELLTTANYQAGLKQLAIIDQDIAAIIAQFGMPPEWTRPAGFATLVKIILEQKVSLASAQAVYLRLEKLTNPLTPANLLMQHVDKLYQAGVSRQKIIYCRALASAIVSGEFDLTELETLADEAAMAALVKLKGIGNWTAGIYLLMALRRIDIWPRGDLALNKAVAKVKGIAVVDDEIAKLSLRWRPWRAIAARVFWHYYLSTKLARMK